MRTIQTRTSVADTGLTTRTRRRRLSAVLLFGLAVAWAATGQAATVYKIDIDSTTSGGGLGLQTEPGWTSLDATEPSENDSVTVDGVVFKVTSSTGSRLRTSGGAPNPNALTADFVYDAGPDTAVILHFGVAGDLQAGIWDVDLYSNDSGAQPGNQFAAYRVNGSATIVGNAVTPEAVDPAITFQFESDGTSAYDVFVRERSGNDRSRLNAVQLTYLTGLSAATDTVLKYNLDDGASDVSADVGTSQTDGVDVLAADLSATAITSGLGWGREDPANGNNANVGNGSGPESQTDDNNTWWARANTLPATPDSTHYASFTVTPDAGMGLDLSDGVLGVKMGATERNEGGNLEFNVTLRSSADGFASDLDVASTAADQNIDDPLYVTSYLDLSSLGTVTDPLEFRLYFSDNSGSGAKHPILDTVFLLAKTEVIPEPATMCALGLAVAGLGGYLRKRRNA